jgi:hypothetical protein
MTADTPPTAIIPSIQPTAAVIASTPQKVHAATQAGGTGKSTSTTDNNVITSDGIDLDTQTESNHDTALTLACSGGHDELVALLLQRGADIEHRDKKVLLCERNIDLSNHFRALHRLSWLQLLVMYELSMHYSIMVPTSKHNQNAQRIQRCHLHALVVAKRFGKVDTFTKKLFLFRWSICY